jgi:hypothetical protein
MLNGYDCDGVLTVGVVPERPWVCISGRTHAEAGVVPAILSESQGNYFRGVGPYDVHHHPGRFKAEKINELGVTRFFEDDPIQADIIRASCPGCEVYLVQ